MSGINSITQRSTFIFPSIPRRYGDASITTARNFQPWVTHLLQTVQTYINDSLRCGPCWIYAICGPRREAGRPKPYAVGRNGVGRLLWRYHLTISLALPALSICMTTYVKNANYSYHFLSQDWNVMYDYQFRSAFQLGTNFWKRDFRNIFHWLIYILLPS